MTFRIQSTHVVSSDPHAQGLTLAVPVQQNLVCIASGTLSGSFVTPAISVLHAEHWSATAETAGVVGVCRWEFSNDASINNEYATLSVTGWVPYKNLDTLMSGSDDLTIWNLQNQAYRWLRFRWMHQSGTGSLDLSLTAKG